MKRRIIIFLWFLFILGTLVSIESAYILSQTANLSADEASKFKDLTYQNWNLIILICSILLTKSGSSGFLPGTRGKEMNGQKTRNDSDGLKKNHKIARFWGLSILVLIIGFGFGTHFKIQKGAPSEKLLKMSQSTRTVFLIMSFLMITGCQAIRHYMLTSQKSQKQERALIAKNC